MIIKEFIGVKIVVVNAQDAMVPIQPTALAVHLN